MRSSDEARGLLNIGLARDSSLDEGRRHHGTAHPSGIHCVDDRWAGGDHLLVGIIWMVVRHSFKDNDYSSKNRLGGSPRRNHVTGRPHTDPHPSS